MHTHRRSFVAGFVSVLAALALTGCASTTLENSWRDPQYKGPPLKKVLVVGIARESTTRRIFEDEFVKQLAAIGVQGVQSYNYIPQPGLVDEATLKQAVQKSGANGALVTRYVRKDVALESQPVYMGPTFYGGYAGSWGGYYEPQMVYETVTVVLETRLYGLDDSKLLWSGTTHTFQPSDLQKDIAGFSEVIIGALRKQGLV